MELLKDSLFIIYYIISVPCIVFTIMSIFLFRKSVREYKKIKEQMEKVLDQQREVMKNQNIIDNKKVH